MKVFGVRTEFLPMKRPVYMDHHATTPVDPRVVEAMTPYFIENFGNPASRNHLFGWRAEEAVEAARAQVAGLIGARSREIVFTSGATESINTALKGAAAARRTRGNHIITLQTEHRAVLDSLNRLEEGDFRVSYLPVDPGGLVELERLERTISDETILISVLLANNEIGVIQPVGEIGRIARRHGIVFHVDAAQAVGKIPVSVERDEIDLLSLTAHKFYGPKGVGALYVTAERPSHRCSGIDRRRRARARFSIRHVERAGYRGTRQGLRNRRGRNGGRVRAARGPPRSIARRLAEPAG